MKFLKSDILFSFLICTLFLTNSQASDPATIEEAMEKLGEQIFFDKNLSQPRTQSCASCHDPAAGFTSPSFFVNLTGGAEFGAVRKRAGNRKPPTATYMTFAEDWDGNSGGLFLDGRATGEAIDSSIFPAHWDLATVVTMEPHANAAAHQAMGPFLNPVEQNLPSAEVLCKRVKYGSYADLYAEAWGEPIDCSEPVFVELAHKRIAFAVSVFEASDKVNTFSSLRDIMLAADADGAFPLDGFTDQQNQGRDLFYNINSEGGPRPINTFVTCGGFCHSSKITADGTDPQELYTNTNAAYFNIGVPRNPFNPWYLMKFVRDNDGNIINPLGRNWVDQGLAFRDDDGDGVSDFPDRKGELKMATLRNTASRPFEGFARSYMHNGYFKSLKQVVHFYNTRDIKPVCTNKHDEPQKSVTARRAIKRGCWPVPEVFTEDEHGNPDNIFGCDDETNHCKVELAEGETFETYCDNPGNSRGIGNLCMTSEQEDAIVAYMETLTDLEVMEPPKRKKRRKGKRR